jgi:hypothetical protein
MSDHLRSSSSFTHREYVDKWLALAIAATTFVGYVSSVYWERNWGPRLLLRREIALENEIDRLEHQADAICTTSQLYEHSRLMSSAVVLRRELLEERRKRYHYQLSVESMFSPLSTVHSVRWALKTREQTPTTPRTHPALPANSPAAVTRSVPSSVSQSLVAMHASQREVERLALSKLHSATQPARDFIYYNLIALVKYLLRFGHVLVYLYVFGRRPGLIVVPPSIEASIHFYLTEVVAPYLFGVAMFGPAILFAPRQTLVDDAHASTLTTNISLARLDSDPYGVFSDVRGCTGDASDTAATILLIKRYNVVRLCVSNNIVCWFLCCLCSSYLVMRVFAS